MNRIQMVDIRKKTAVVINRRGGGNSNGIVNRTFTCKAIFSLSWKFALLVYITFLSFNIITQLNTGGYTNDKIGITKQQQQRELIRYGTANKKQEKKQQEQQSITVPNPIEEIIQDEKENEKLANGENDIREEYKEEVVAAEEDNNNNNNNNKPEDEIPIDIDTTDTTDTTKTDVQDIVNEISDEDAEENVDNNNNNPNNSTAVVEDYREEVASSATEKEDEEEGEETENEENTEGDEGTTNEEEDAEDNNTNDDTEAAEEGETKDDTKTEDGEGEVEKGQDKEDDKGNNNDDLGADNQNGDRDSNTTGSTNDSKDVDNDVVVIKTAVERKTINKEVSAVTVFVVNDKGVQETLNKVGTGPTKLGYVVDLIKEQYYSSFRNQTQLLLLLHDSELIKKKVLKYITNDINNDGASSSTSSTINLRQCVYEIQNKLYQLSECSTTQSQDDVPSQIQMTKTVYVYNSAPFHRTMYKCNAFNNIDNPNIKLSDKQTVVIPPNSVGSLGTILSSTDDDTTTCLNQPARYFHVSHHRNTDGKQQLDVTDINDDGTIIVTPVPLETTVSSSILNKFDLQRIDQCDVSCKFPKSIIEKYSNKIQTAPLLNLYIAGTNWKIIRSMNNPYEDMQSQVERTAYKNDIFYSTTSFRSSVPLSFYDYEFGTKYIHNTTSLNWKTAANKGTYILNTDCNAYKRNKWFAAINAVLPVESYGTCGHNTNVKKNESIKTITGRIQIQKKNRMVLVFENGNSKDHLTFQIWEALVSGAVPIIHGAINAAKHLPISSTGQPSAIYTSDFNTWDRLASYVQNVSSNQSLWESFHMWRTDPIAIQKFYTLYNFTHISPDCRLCMWAYSKKFGLGWDHVQQTIKDETYIPRRVCFAVDNGVVTHPFIETYVQSGSQLIKRTIPPRVTDTKDSCHKAYLMKQSEAIDVQQSSALLSSTSLPITVSRRVFYHDGVTDIFIDSIMRDDEEGKDETSSSLLSLNSITLRLQFNIKNTEGGYFPNPHTLITTNLGSIITSIAIQDRYAKVIILCNWITSIHSPIDGIVEIYLGNPNNNGNLTHIEIPKRIRIITEDINEIHHKDTEFYPSHFGKIMMKDFIDPIDYFVSYTNSTTNNNNIDGNGVAVA